MSDQPKTKPEERSKVETRFVELPMPFEYQVEWFEDGSEHHIGKLWHEYETVIRPSYVELLAALSMPKGGEE